LSRTFKEPVCMAVVKKAILNLTASLIFYLFESIFNVTRFLPLRNKTRLNSSYLRLVMIKGIKKYYTSAPLNTCSLRHVYCSPFRTFFALNFSILCLRTWYYHSTANSLQNFWKCNEVRLYTNQFCNEKELLVNKSFCVLRSYAIHWKAMYYR